MGQYVWTRVGKSVSPYDRELRPSWVTVIGRVRFEWYEWGKVIAYADDGAWELHAGGCPHPRAPFWDEGKFKRTVFHMAIRKLQQVVDVQPGGQAGTVADAPLYPTLWEHLSLTCYPDGMKRQTSFLMVFSGEGSWRGCLKDVDNGRLCWKTGATLEELLSSLEDAAAKDDPTDWRKEIAQQKRSSRKSS